MNGVLLDTHSFLWIITDDPKLSRKAKATFLDLDRQLVLSVASIWELAIKHSLGRIVLPTPLGAFVVKQALANAISVLEIKAEHAAAVAELPFHHRDPFDRLLVAQAVTEDLAIMTADKMLKKYGVRTIW